MTVVYGDGCVRFRFYRPAAMRVSVAGDFNHWRGDSLRMQRDSEEGWWTAEAQLDPGSYRFRYLADDRWFTDFAAHGVESCPGGWNGVLVVPSSVSGYNPTELNPLST